MMLLLPNDGNRVRSWGLGSVPTSDDEIGAWINCVATVVALEEELGKVFSRLPPYSLVPLFLQTALAAWAAVVAVLLLLLLRLWGELIFVAFDGFPDELGVHFLEDRHQTKVGS